MGFLDRLRPGAGESAGAPEIARSSSVAGNEKQTTEPEVLPADQSKNIKSVASEDVDDDEVVHKDMQTGVQKIEGMAQVWPKWALYFTYAW
jgi:propanediol dehydratase small subunit